MTNFYLNGTPWASNGGPKGSKIAYPANNNPQGCKFARVDNFSKLKARCLRWSDVHFIVIATTFTAIIVSDLSPSLPAKQWSCDSLQSCNVYFATNAEIRYGHDACGGGDCGGGGNGGGVFSLHRKFCVIGDFRLAGL